MTTDARTIAFYDTAAERYDTLTKSGVMDARLRAFVDLIPKGGRVLDLGCGPARASVHMRAAGLHPDPVDASTGMVKLANAAHDIGARLMTFAELDAVAAYDGVWANFSLLHAAPEDLPTDIAAIHTALKPNGIFHIGMKVGDGQKRDAIERLYTYVSVDGLKSMLDHAGFDILAIEEGHEVGMAGTNDPFVIMRARKRG